MNRRTLFLGTAFGAMILATGMVLADDDSDTDDAGYCIDVSIEPFHMIPGAYDEFGACAVRDYWGGDLQETFYPFTKEDHPFNCEVFGNEAPLPVKIEDSPLYGAEVPSSVASQGDITGTIGGHDFIGTLYCASLTNGQLAQPFLNHEEAYLPYPRVTEVSVFDGLIMVQKRKKVVEVPILLATRAAGITHLEVLAPDPSEVQVGASVTHSALGMLTYEEDGDDVEDVKVLKGSLDLLLQGHIFSPNSVANDPGAARVKGTICSKDLYKLLNK